MLAAEPVEASCNRAVDGRSRATIRAEPLRAAVVRPLSLQYCQVKRHRFPPAIIQYAVWLYHRLSLSHRDIEDLPAARGIEAGYEPVRLWCNKFGPLFSKRLKRRHPGFGDAFFIDEAFVTTAGH
jgi:transposase-like protein